MSNGITVIFDPNAHAKTACVLVGVNIGANHEEAHEHGLAHFFEHMCFKGTETYPDYTQLLVRMDESGVVGNAYTSREYTGYYLFGRAERIGDMMDITSDIFLRSLFPAGELEKEKSVIVEEIAMYEDDPAAKAGNEVEKSLFHGTAAEHDILGTADSVRSFSRDDFVQFLRKHYVSGNIIISVAGKFDSEEVFAALERMYRSAPVGGHTEQVAVSAVGVKQKHVHVVRSDLEQSHIVIGGYAPSCGSDDRHALQLLGTVLGGSMSSRLFLRVREHLGACYTINASADMNAHYGSFSIYTGINGKRTEEVMGAVADECAAVLRDTVSDDELRKAREYILGVRAVQQESTQGIAGRNMVLYAQTGAVESDEEYEKHIRAVTPADVRRVAEDIFVTDTMAVCYVGSTEVPETVTDSFLNTIARIA